VVSCVSIAYIATHAQNWYGTYCALLIGIISVVIETYQTPPLCASCSSSKLTSDAVSAKGIKAQMPHPILTHVFGKPTHKQVKTVIRKLSTNLMATSCSWGHSKGHLGLLQVQPSTWYATERRSTSQILNLQPTQPSQPVPQLPNARN
jgi:hypothetical protein